MKSITSRFVLFALAFTAFAVKAEPLKVATWNIAWLGSHEYNKRDAEDYKALAKYANVLDADVVALQEVENEAYARKVLGDDYEYFFSTRDWVQRVGVAVKKSTGFKVSAKEFKELEVGRARYGMDVLLHNGDKKLRLLAVHLKSGCFDKKLDQGSVKRMRVKDDKDKYRKIACATLSNQIWPLEQWIDARAKEDAPYIVLGDFNRRFRQDVEKNYKEDEGLWQAIDDEGNEKLWTPTMTQDSKCWGGYYKDYIDHIVLDPRAKAKFKKGSFEQLVFEGKYSRDLSNALSDHCPIAITLDI